MAFPEDGALSPSPGCWQGTAVPLHGASLCPGAGAVSRGGVCRDPRRWLWSSPAGRCVRGRRCVWGFAAEGGQYRVPPTRGGRRRCAGEGGGSASAPATLTGARGISPLEKTARVGLRPRSQPPWPLLRPGPPRLRRRWATRGTPPGRAGLGRAAPPAPAKAGLRSAGGGGARHPRDRGANQGAGLALPAHLRPPPPGHGEVRRGKRSAAAVALRSPRRAPWGSRASAARTPTSPSG